MDLSYNANVVEEADFREIVSKTFKEISKVVEPTLGPNGGFTLVTDYTGKTPVIPSKDGYRNMLSILYNNRIQDIIYRIVIDVCGKINTNVGDGTTSSVVIAQTLYKDLMDFVDEQYEKGVYITPGGFSRVLKLIIKKVVKLLQDKYVVTMEKLSKEQRYEVYRRVATIAANGDSDIGKNVADLFIEKEDPSIFVDLGINRKGVETILESEKGFEMNSGYIHESMVTEPNGVLAEFQDPRFLIVNGPIAEGDLENLKELVTFNCLEKRRPLIIIASEYERGVKEFLIGCRMGLPIRQDKNEKPKLVQIPIAAMTVNGSTIGSNEKSLIDDLRTSLGGIVLETKTKKIVNFPDNDTIVEHVLGSADKIVLGPHYCRITNGKGDPKVIQERIQELEDQIEHLTDTDEMYLMRKIATYKRRIGILKSVMIKINVGGETYKEKEMNKLIIEDAVFAVKSTIKHGFTIGGNLSIYNGIKSHIDELTKRTLEDVKNDNIRLVIGVGLEENIEETVIRELLHVIAMSSTSAYKTVLLNAYGINYTAIHELKTDVFPEEEKCGGDVTKVKILDVTDNILKGCSPMLDINDEHNQYRESAEIIVPGNTDIEILSAAINIISLLLNSNQMMTSNPKDLDWLREKKVDPRIEKDIDEATI